MTAHEIDLAAVGAELGPIWDRMAEAAVVGLRVAAERTRSTIVAKIVPQVAPRAPIDRGVYRAGWKTAPLPTGAEIYNDERHAAFIEYGVRSSNVKIGKRMIDALAEWAMRKRLAKNPREARRIAWAIARRAASRGGLAFFAGPQGRGARVLETAVRDYVPQFIREEITRAMRGVM